MKMNIDGESYNNNFIFFKYNINILNNLTLFFKENVTMTIKKI